MLDATMRIAARDGISGLTTNHIAEVAGVSVGSVYQYFPDKDAIYVALHERHVEDMSRVVERALTENASASLEQTIRALLVAIIDAHRAHPELDELLALVPRNATRRQRPRPTFAERLREVLGLVLHAHRSRRGSGASDVSARTEALTLFLVSNLVDSFAHAIASRRPPSVPLERAIDEIARVATAYMR